MKRRKIFLPFIFLITFIVMFGGITSSAHAHNHGEDSHQHEHSAVVHEHELEEVDPDKEAKEVFCCVPGSPKESYFIYTHYTKSSTVCEFYQQRITQCLNCNSVVSVGSQQYMNTHHPNTH